MLKSLSKIQINEGHFHKYFFLPLYKDYIMNNSFLNRSEIWREQPKLVQQQPPLLHARLRPGRLCRGDRQP